MAPKSEAARDFLSTRRAKITPDRAGLPTYGGNRRVPGLRREEVALLAGVSADYYTRLEKGNLRGVSEEVLDALARALQLDDDERTYLFDLARSANATGRPTRAHRRRRPAGTVRQPVQLLLDSMVGAAALVHDGRLDVLGANHLGRALFAPVFDSPTRTSQAARPNLARFVFLDPAARAFYPDPEQAAPVCVELLRAHAGHDPYDKGLTDLVGELSTRSEDFRTRWATHDVHAHRSGTKHIHHAEVGDLTLEFESLHVATDAGLTLSAYLAEPGSPSADRLRLLASWAAAGSPASADAGSAD